MGSYNKSELQVGQSESFSKTIAECDVYTFAGVTGDFNAAHMNEVYAKNTRFGKRIAHGMLSAGLISTVIGTLLPGVGTIYLEQNLKFLVPVYIGDTVTATVTVEAIDLERNRATLQTICTNQEGKQVISGTALVMPPK